jgi:N-acetylglucosaminyldiphosphoundecaprenol N-acetyl-beta-D-mannosaminyltransferase
MKRLFDILTSGALLVLLAPVFLYRAVLAYRQTQNVFVRDSKLGYQQKSFGQYRFAGDAAFCKHLPILLNVLAGDLAWAGVRALTIDEAKQLSVLHQHHFDFKPGVVSAYNLRQKIGLAYEDEFSTDHAFFQDLSLKNYIGFCIRALIGVLLGGNKPRPTPPMLHFFGVDIVNTTMSEALDWIEERIQKQQKALLAFVNPACLNIAYTDKAYLHVLQQADRVLPDGIGINIGCRLLNQALLANVNGTDMFPRLCERAAAGGYSLFLLGGLPDVAAQAAQAMQQRYPDLKIAGTQDGFFKPDDENQVIATINASGAAILLVGFGVPKQELWLAQHHGQLQVTVQMGIGGLFDYYSGRIPRAPVWMREIGMEWSWRLLQEPGRMWRRYLIGNPLFLYRVWLQRQQG